jgi:2'-5' RNA ligase
MRLSASIVPPPEVLDELDSIVRSVSAATARRPRRLAWRGPSQDAGDPGGVDQLSRPPVARIQIPLATFGHLTRVDSDRVADELRTAVATWRPPTLSVTGGTALAWPGDRSVWAGLTGDLDELQIIAQGVPKVVQRHGLFVDRREFRPWIQIGTITDLTTGAYLEDLVAALKKFRGRAWTQDSISLMKGQPEGEAGDFEELERLPLASS